ncbi:kinase-associated lipoprotein B [Evansella sp. AB-P1]|uniref:kinase-associated lipoprotein B n=1 Tax=Evansella sp. AB-P1 TaxID=3037653 RepID=UPI00241FD8F1|nr:kinase-associated lipoprotein B [Evansella sp. AB-P1]MDG5788447.1 kinase-associated lipoprotein B [Evansella sp. AB-P1]
MEKFYNIGDIVTGIYKTGKYIGEITEVKKDRYVISILAVVKHPQQGDLHHPKGINVPFFHERRALAFKEKTNIPKAYIKEYKSEIPLYVESLKDALKKEKDVLISDESEWAKKSLELLNNLEKEYFKQK